MGALGKIDWLWFAAGIIFSMFVLPFLMNFFAKMRGTGTRKVA